jgi:stearoyl-CoA desaturase (Delta-9 desaturase)
MNQEISTNKARLNSVGSIPFFMVHLGAVVMPFFVRFRWTDILLAIALYEGRMFFVATGFHRYFAHRSYKTTRAYQFLLAFFSETTAQKGILWWAGHHRAHHLYSDTDDDIHSPTRRGFWWSHVGWILDYRFEATDFDRIKDFAQYPELRWLNRYHWVPPLTLAVVLGLVGGMEAVVWGFLVSTVLLWHGTFTINSLAHVFGRRRYVTTDTSRNSWVLALITHGEGWHNNHHYYQSSANQGFYWWEIDLGYYGLRALQAIGVVWDVRKPPPRVLEAGKVRAPVSRQPAPATLPVFQPSPPAA